MTHFLICYLSLVACWILLILDSMHRDCRDMEHAIENGYAFPIYNR